MQTITDSNEIQDLAPDTLLIDNKGVAYRVVDGMGVNHVVVFTRQGTATDAELAPEFAAGFELTVVWAPSA